MRKKFLCLLLSIISVFIFAGCANIEYHRVTDDTGQIIDRLIVELHDNEIIEKIGEVKFTALKQDIEGDFNDYIQAINNMKPHLQVENPEMDFSTGIVAERSSWIKNEENISKITIQIVYKNSAYLQALNGSSSNDETQEDSDDTEIINNLFISKYMMYSDNVFSDIDETAYYQYYTASYGEFNMSDVNLTQVYGTTDNRLRSDADYIENIEGINYHLWDIETENDAYKVKKLSYHYRTAVGTGWYILALGLSLVLAIILIIVYIIKRKNTKKHMVKIDLNTFNTEEGNKDNG